MWQGQSITTWWGDLGYACRIQTTKVVASSSLSSTTCTKWQVWIDLCARKRKWRDPLFPGQSSSQLQSAAFCCFFFCSPWLPETLLTVQDLAASMRGRFQETSRCKGDQRGGRQRCVYVCVICTCVGPVWEQTVRLMYPGLPPEETKQYLHGDFVLSPISLLPLFYPAIM
jgi:hypothetical protein